MLVSTAADIQPALGVRPLNSPAGIEVWGLVDPVELAFQANEELSVEGVALEEGEDEGEEIPK